MKTNLLFIAVLLGGLSFLQAQPADFMVGRYLLTNGTSDIGPAFGDTNLAETLVNISVGGLPNERVLTVQLLPVNNGSVNQIVLDLSGDEFTFPTVSSGLACGTGNPIITYGPASTGNNSTWSILAGDQVLTINYTENTLGSCGEAITQSNFTLTEFPADQTYVPDDNFEQALINLGLDTVLDDRVLTSNIDAITTLDISNQGISDLTGLNDFTGLTNLNISTNQISGVLNLTNFTNLTSVSAGSNQLTAFIGSDSIELISLGANQITENDYSNYVNLESLFINQNPIQNNLRVPNSLLVLNSFGTLITSADLSNASLLTSLVISSNSQLEYINLKNNNNSSLSSFIGNNNPNLVCIEVDDVNYMTTTFSTQIDSGQSYVASCNNATRTFVPDNNFEQALIDLGLDTVLDNFITNSNVDTETTLDISNKAIADLRGLEAFVALQTLEASNNAITSFNSTLVNNATSIDMDSNRLVDVDMSNSNSITRANFFFNTSLQNIDISGANNLDFFDAGLSRISTVNTSNNPNLRVLRLPAVNTVTNIDVSQNPLLERLDVFICPLLTGIDVTQNPLLQYLRYGASLANPTVDYPITTIDLSNNVNLTELINLGSRISAVDVSMLTNLRNFTWVYSGLSAIDLTNQAAATRILVDNNLLTSIALPPLPNNLIQLNMENNLVTNLDVSNFPSLAFLNAANNQLNSLDITNTINLESLDVSNNNISSLDLSNKPLLELVLVNDNNLLDIDLSGSPILQTLNADNNNLMSLNVDNGMNNLITGFSSLGNTGLTCIKVSDLNYMSTNFANQIDATASFDTTCVTASIADIEIELNLYPNPTSDIVTISTINQNINLISVYDISGRIVKQVQPENLDTSFSLNVAPLRSGQYLLVIDTESGRAVENLIKK